MFTRRQCLAGILAALGSSAAGPLLAAPGYPDKLVTLVVPHPAGGFTDSVGRLVANGLADTWKSSVIVDNRTGAGGVIGMTHAARRDPDGYTLFLSSSGTDVISPLVNRNLKVDPATELQPVVLVARTPNVIVVSAGSDIHSLADLVKVGKANPGKLNVGNPGRGTNSHFSGLMFASAAGIEIAEVAYRGSPAVLTDLVNGNIQVAADNIVFWAQHVKSGRARALAVTSAQRSPLLPDVPTVAESGFADFESSTFTGISVPRGTPATIVSKLNRDIIGVIGAEAFRKALPAAEIGGGTPESFGAMMQREREKIGAIVEKLNIVLE